MKKKNHTHIKHTHHHYYRQRRQLQCGRGDEKNISLSRSWGTTHWTLNGGELRAHTFRFPISTSLLNALSRLADGVSASILSCCINGTIAAFSQNVVFCLFVCFRVICLSPRANSIGRRHYDNCVPTIVCSEPEEYDRRHNNWSNNSLIILMLLNRTVPLEWNLLVRKLLPRCGNWWAGERKT